MKIAELIAVLLLSNCNQQEYILCVHFKCSKIFNSFENFQNNAEKENKDYKAKLRRFENDLHDKVKYDMYFC